MTKTDIVGVLQSWCSLQTHMLHVCGLWRTN